MERRLAAILAADMVGYSRLMAADETGTIARQKQHRTELIDPKIAEYGGRVVKTTGDGVLVEFPSVVDALRCAVTIQLAMQAREANVPPENRIAYRVGINLGDIVVEDDDIYGDGVNVAARLEALAEPGGICVSRTVVNHVTGKVNSDFDDLGEQSVKNIPKPVHVFRVQTAPEEAGTAVVAAQDKKWWKRPSAAIAAAGVLLAISAAGIMLWQPWGPAVQPASVDRMAFPLPDKPSIAVLPFTNMSDDPSQGYFADGMTEDLITDLSKISGLFVIARNSSFSYKGKQVKVRQVAEELGVRYVLEGSVRRADKQVRVNAQLIDATTGGHLWAERYDGSMADVFALQDRVTQKIVSALAVQLAARSETQTVQGGTKNAAAYDEFLQGWEHYKRRTPADFVKAVRFFERAVEMDPEYGRAYAALAIVYWKSWLWSVLTMSPAINVTWTRRLQIPLVYAPDRAKEYLQKAMNNPTPLAYQVASEMRWRERQYDEALAKAESAIALNTNDPVGYVAMAEVLIYSGRAKEAVQFVEKAMRLDPHSAVNLYLLGLAHFSMGQMDKAATLFKRGVKRSPFSQWWNVPLAATYAHLGRDQDAQAALREWAGMIGLLDIVDLWPFRDVDIAEHFAVGVVKAGVCCDAGLERYLSDLRNRDP